MSSLHGEAVIPTAAPPWGAPVIVGPAVIVAGSNVVVVLVGGSHATVNRVEQVVARLAQRLPRGHGVIRRSVVSGTRTPSRSSWRRVTPMAGGFRSRKKPPVRCGVERHGVRDAASPGIEHAGAVRATPCGGPLRWRVGLCTRFAPAKGRDSPGLTPSQRLPPSPPPTWPTYPITLATPLRRSLPDPDVRGGPSRAHHPFRSTMPSVEGSGSGSPPPMSRW